MSHIINHSQHDTLDIIDAIYPNQVDLQPEYIEESWFESLFEDADMLLESIAESLWYMM